MDSSFAQGFFFSRKNTTFTFSILELSVRKCFIEYRLYVTLFGASEPNFCSVEGRAELEEANTGMGFSTLPTWNPLHIISIRFPEPNRETKAQILAINLEVEAGKKYLLST